MWFLNQSIVFIVMHFLYSDFSQCVLVTFYCKLDTGISNINCGNKLLTLGSCK